MKKIFLALCVCAGLCACSDDVIDGVSSSSSITLDGNDVYLTVRLSDVNSATRATEGTPPYVAGSEAEQAVTDAWFYFYDENGDFVSRAEVWDGGTEATPSEGNHYIEFQSNTVIVLKGLTDKKFPRYMVTVLNEPSTFEDGTYSDYYEPAGTLDEFQVKLSSPTYTGIYNDGESGYFVMSTSAYNAPSYTGQWATDESGTDVSPWYFVTPINEENFSLEPIDATTAADPINVYVERLAAKVEVGVASSMENERTMEDVNGNEHTVYLLDESVAGTANDSGTEISWVDPTTGQTTTLEGTDHLYVEFLGWALNGTARYSNIVKNITELDAENGITTPNLYNNQTNVWTTWNDADNFRSYWGKSFNYGVGTYDSYPITNINPNMTYPDGQEANYDENESSEDATEWLNPYLKYTSLLDANLHEFGLVDEDPEYCAENTNTPEILVNKRCSGITNALVKAQIWTENADNELVQDTIIRFEGMLFTMDAFKLYIAQRVGIDTYIGVYHWMDNTNYDPMTFDEDADYTLQELTDLGLATDTWTTLSYDMLYLENKGNDSLYIELDDITFDQTTTLVFYQDGTDEVTGEALYHLVPAADVQAVFDAAEEELADINESYEINGYNNGLMYYSIPIEHLNNDYPVYEEPMPDEGQILIAEGNYGIVRNHWYQLSINSLANVGKGIWDEYEVIIPDPTDPVSYYVEADVLIHAWHMVSQGVDL